MSWDREQMAARAAQELLAVLLVGRQAGAFRLIETAPGVSVADIERTTAAPVDVSAVRPSS